ncbi:lipid-transfer protein [Candidatus Poriferisocius sp.]|uniref:lipid-transfer protein n=1 Tax=Candidatus Poriferisocius sp. TaxID=3101276 RepID=UPI003B02671B
MVSLAEDVAIVAFAQTPSHARFDDSEPAMIMPCVNSVVEQVGLDRHDIDFTIAGSCDYLSGMPFAFVMNIDAVGAWPPVYESHVEMDGAWALFEGFVRLQSGDIDTVLVSGSGKCSPGSYREGFSLQTDPYVHAPLGLDPRTQAGFQAQALIAAGKATERDFAGVVARSHANARSNPYAQLSGDPSVEELLARPYVQQPLRGHDCPPTSDGAAAMIIARAEKAEQLCDNPVWIRAIDHRIESHHPTLRDLTDSPSVRTAAQRVGLHDGPVDVAELTVTYSPEEIILRAALGLDEHTQVNPSGGPLTGSPFMAVGLTRVIELTRAITNGKARRGVAHASSGPALQQNLLCVLEGNS